MWNRHWRDRQWFTLCLDGEDTGAGGGGGGDDTQTLDYLKAEAKKAFEKRDQLAKQLKDLQTKVLSDEDRAEFDKLRTERADIEEKKKRAEGQFDSLKTELVTKHETERKKLETDIQALQTYITQTEIDRAFMSATKLFGGADATTVLPADVASAYFRTYVDVVDDAHGRKRVVVKNPKGDVIHGADGNPAPFEHAMSELIGQLPDSTKDRILRGSGKSGSGSSDGSTGSTTGKVDLNGRLTADQLGDKTIRDALKKRHQQAGGLVFGRAFEKLGR